MFYYLGYLIGVVLVVWPLSAIFAFIQKLITKKVTRNTVIITTIIAGLLCLVGVLFGEWEPGKVATACIGITIGTLLVLRSRLNRLKRKAKT